jgi:hypothetical protein
LQKGEAGAKPSARSKADAALLAAQGEFAECLGQDILRIDTVWATLGSAPTKEQVAQLYMRAHDLKALGATSGFPIVTAIAAQLCQLIDDQQGFECHAGFVADHVDALKEVFRRQIRTQEHPFGRQILSELRRDFHIP